MNVWPGPHDFKLRSGPGRDPRDEIAELRSKLSSVRLALFVLIALDTARWAVILYDQFSS